MLTFIRMDLKFQVHALQWLNEKPMLAVLGQLANGTGKLYIYKLVKNELIPEHGNCSFMTMPNAMGVLGNDLVIAEESQLSIWDPTDLVLPKKVISLKSSVQCMDCFGGSKNEPGPPEIVVGTTNKIELYDVREDKPVVEIFEKMQPWAVAFGNAQDVDNRNVAVGFANGFLKIYDLTKQQCIWEVNTGSLGICCLEFSNKIAFQTTITAGCLRGVFHVFHIADLKNVVHLIHENKEEPATIWTLGHSPQNPDKVMICVNNIVQLFQINKDTLKLVDSIHGGVEQPINKFQWNKKLDGLCAFSSYDQVLNVMMVANVNK